MSSPLGDLEQCFERLRIAIIDVSELAANSKERVSNYCEFLRQDIEIIFESKTEEMRTENMAKYSPWHVYKLQEICKQYIRDITTYEKNRLTSLETGSEQHDDTALRNAVTFRDKCLDNADFNSERLTEAINTLSQLNEYKQKLRMGPFNWVKPTFTTDYDSCYHLGSLRFESVTLPKLKDMRVLKLDWPDSYQPEYRAAFGIERLNNDTYFVVAERLATCYSLLYLLFDRNGALTCTVAHPYDQFGGIMTLCHVENRVVVGYEGRVIKIIDCSSGIEVVKQLNVSYACHRSSLYANHTSIFHLHLTQDISSSSSVIIYNWSLELLKCITQSVNTLFVRTSIYPRETFAKVAGLLLRTDLELVRDIDEETIRNTSNEVVKTYRNYILNQDKFKTSRYVFNTKKEIVEFSDKLTLNGWRIDDNKHLYENQICECKLDKFSDSQKEKHTCILNECQLKIREDDSIFLFNAHALTLYL